MFKNYLQIAFRNLLRNKIFSIINILGLAAGFCACLLIARYIQHQVSFDKFQPNGKRIARVIMEYSFDGSPQSNRGNYTSTKVGPVLTSTFPEVEMAVRMSERQTTVFHEAQMFNEPDFLYADPQFFRLFSASFIGGAPQHALDGPHKVVLTRHSAMKYFGRTDISGETLLIGSERTPYLITGILEDYPSNSQLKFDFVASFSSLDEDQRETYFEANFQTYLLLDSPNDFEPLQSKITAFMKKEMEGSGASINYLLEPFEKVHLYSEFPAFVPNTSITYLYTLSAVAMLTLIIVCFTYVNLSTARSIDRAREVGVRKAIGAARKQLFWQFVGESCTSCLLALGVGYLLAETFLPYFNRLTNESFRPLDLLTPQFVALAVLTTLVVGFFAGAYPAGVLTKYNPVTVLKGKFTNTSGGKSVQQVLIVFQFIISIILIASTFIIQNQLYYIQHKKLGFDRDHVVVIPGGNEYLNVLPVLKKEFKSNPDVLQVSACVAAPIDIFSGFNMRSGAMPEDQQIAVAGTPIDNEYIRATGLQLIAGSDLTEQDMKDIEKDDEGKRIYHFILNESACKVLGWQPSEAINQKFVMGFRSGVVSGVVRDFNFESMHVAIRPVVLFTETRIQRLLVKVSGNDLPATLSFLETKWKQIIPSRPFEYSFMDDDYNALYKSELQLGRVMRIFSAMAVLLACSGLFGLSFFVIEQKNREISIRKILGAPLSAIVSALSAGFTRLVFLSTILGLPVVYFLMSRWLQDFAYRVDIGWEDMLIAAILILAIALLTISAHVLRATTANPVKYLRE